MHASPRLFATAILLGVAAVPAHAQKASPLPDSTLVRALTFRSIGPASMGGRIVDIAVAENPKSVRGGRLGTVMYIAAATGGVFKTTNAGVSWTPVFDSVRTGSIGAVAVSPSNSDIVWVGTGEPNNMRSSSWGTGVYKSSDGGKTWSGAMLPKSQHIGRIVVDPRDPNVVYVAAMGPLWSSGGERGIFKTTDGGKTWTNTKNISANTGFTELIMDPSNPDVLYAASLERERREYGFLPAGPESGIWKTRDAGKTWTQLTSGLPTGELGRIGLAVCRSHPATLYSVIHAKGAANGIYRSDDTGSTWHQINGVNATAWYYSQVRCDPQDPEHVVSLSAASRESYDGGKTWANFATAPVHSDSHVLWINPEAPEEMILGNDGGLYTTYDRGRTWSHSENIVAAQFYAIAVDDAQPFYNVYGGLQDNQQWGGPSRTRNTFGPTNADWFRMHGGDGFYAVPDPWDYNLVYAEMQGGGVVRYDQRTGQAKNIKPVPKEGDKQRFNWSAPILPSRHDPKTVYMAANYLYRSPDRGDSWVTISPDLTRGIDRNKLPMRGGVPDSLALGRNEGTAEFSNISSIDESPLKAGVIVVGTDDGLIQVTRDGGKSWTKTEHFPGAPDTIYVSRVIFSKANEGTIYATLDGHRSNDFKPYVLKSTDFGHTWNSIASDLPDGGSVQVIREHPRQPNLLFVGTEFGVYFTIDGGGHWTQLKSGIPGVPVHDLQIQSRWNDLVVGTHGRGIFILDDLAPLEHLAQAKQAQVAFMFPIRDELDYQPNATRSSGMGTSGFTGQNPELGARIAYVLNDIPADAKATIAIVDASGTVIRQMAANNKQGLFRQYWDMRVGPPLTGTVTDTLPPGTVAAGGRGGRGGAAGGGAGGGGGGAGGPGGGRGGGDALFPALPGTYKARLTLTSTKGAPTVLEQSFTLRKDPMVTLAESEMKQLYTFRLSVASFQKTLREKQAQADTAQRKFAEVRRAADSSSAKLTPDAKAKLAALTKEMGEIIAQVGAPPGAGRGGFGGGGAGGGGRAGGGRGGAGGGRAGGGGRGAPTDTTAAGGAAAGGAAGAGGVIDDQNALPPTQSVTTVQAKFNSLSEMLNISFAVSEDQRKTLQALPADLQKQMDRVNKIVSDELPALIKALKESGIDLKTGGNN